MPRSSYRYSIPMILFFSWLLVSVPAHADQLQQSLQVLADSNSDASKSQQKIDELARETQRLLEEYRQLLDTSAYQQAYTQELQERDQAQQALIASLEAQIAQARITRQRIIPLMRTMAEALERFVVLDLPFHHESRINAVLVLQRHLQHGELSVAARFRLLLEAYQLEQAYGNNLEAWRGPLKVEDKSLSVEFLRIGRVALYYQTLDGQQSGFWNAAQGRWTLLQVSHNQALGRALRVAKNLGAPQLLNLPMSGPSDS